MNQTGQVYPKNSPADRPAYTREALLIGIVALLLLLFLSTRTTLWDRDEPRFARAAVEMYRSGNYLVPTFNGEIRPDKPVLIYWLMTIGLRIAGTTELAVRGWSAIGMIAAGLLTYLTGRRMYTGRVGLWAMIILISSVLPIYIGAAAMTDGVLLGLITACMALSVRILYDKSYWWDYTLLGLLLGAAQLTKGPVGLAIPLMSIVATVIIGRRNLVVPAGFAWKLLVSILISFILFAAWGVPANTASDGVLLQEGIGRHVISRMAGPMEGHGGSGVPGYLAALPLYFPFLIAGFFPWILFLPAAISGLVRKHIGTGSDRAVLWGWILPTFILMCLVATKLPHYILPVFPALSIACAAMMEAAEAGRLSEKDRDWLRGGVWFFGPMAFIYLLAPTGLLTYTKQWTLLMWWAPPTVILTAVVILAIRRQLAERIHTNAVLLVMLMFTAIILASMHLLPAVDSRMKISPHIAMAIHEAFDEPVPVFAEGYEEPSMIFYLDQPVDMPVRGVAGGIESLRDWSTAPGPAALVVTRLELEQAEVEITSLNLKKLAEFSTINYSSSGSAMTVMVYARGSDATLQPSP